MSDLADLLPADFDGREELVNNFKDVPGLAKSYRELFSKQGSMMSVPKDDTGRVNVMRKHFGAGEKPDDYTVPADAPDDIKGVLDALREDAAAEGLPKSAWDKIASKAAKLTGERRGDFDKKLSEISGQWEKEAREAFGDKYDTTVGAAQRIVTELSTQDPSIAGFLDATGLSTNGAMTQFFTKIFKHVSPDKIISGSGGGKPMEETPQALKARIIEITTGEDWKLPQYHPKKEQLRSEHTAIYKKLLDQGINSITEIKDEQP